MNRQDRDCQFILKMSDLKFRKDTSCNWWLSHIYQWAGSLQVKGLRTGVLMSSASTQSLTSKCALPSPPLPSGPVQSLPLSSQGLSVRPGADGPPISELGTEANTFSVLHCQEEMFWPPEAPWMVQRGLNGSRGLKVYMSCYNTIKQCEVERRSITAANSKGLLCSPTALGASGVSQGERAVKISRTPSALSLLPNVVGTTPQFLKDSNRYLFLTTNSTYWVRNSQVRGLPKIGKFMFIKLRGYCLYATHTLVSGSFKNKSEITS